MSPVSRKPVFDRLVTFLAVVAGVLIVFVTFSVCLDVLLRFFLHKPMQWVIEIAEYILVYMTFLGAAWVLRVDGHVRMDMVLEHLKPRARALLNGITFLGSGIMCAVLTWYGVEVSWEKFRLGLRFSSMMGFPMGPIYAVIPLGFFLLTVQFLILSKRYFGSWSELRHSNRENTESQR